MITLDTIRTMAERLPGMVEVRAYGTPGWKVRKKFVARLHQKEDAIVLVTTSIKERDALIAKDPSVFYLVEHYRKYAALLVRPTISEKEFFPLLENAWKIAGGKYDS
jgi:hypothetical protein